MSALIEEFASIEDKIRRIIKMVCTMIINLDIGISIDRRILLSK